MYSCINKVILIGNVGNEPIIRRFENGGIVGNFSLATTEIFTDKNTNEKRNITDWHNIVVWKGLAEITEKYVNKGAKLYIEGKLKTRTWTDRDGKVNHTTEIFTDNLIILSKNEKNQHKNETIYTNDGVPPYPSPIDNIEITDDLPF
jgi:single-strand DNA-binding protein